jgi:hypothetical protein
VDPEQGDLGPSATWSLDGTPIGVDVVPGTPIGVDVVPGTGAPSVAITSPSTDSSFAAPTPITFTASATTAGGATTPDADISWSDDVDGALGTGHTVTKTLSGSSGEIITHHVTVTATDSGNSQRATDQVTVNDGGIC